MTSTTTINRAGDQLRTAYEDAADDVERVAAWLDRHAEHLDGSHHVGVAIVTVWPRSDAAYRSLVAALAEVAALRAIKPPSHGAGATVAKAGDVILAIYPPRDVPGEVAS